MKRRVLFLADFRKATTGYGGIGNQVCTGLVNLGYDVKAIGIQYNGEEHWNNFSIIPCPTHEVAKDMIKNLFVLWRPEVIIHAADIPIQKKMLEVLTEERSAGLKYIAITALENPPLTRKWAIDLFPADHVFFISQVGVDSAKKVGLSNVSEIDIGIDTKVFYPMESKEVIKKNLGLDGTKNILCVAANQERKNFPAVFKAFKYLTEKVKEDLRLVLVTQVNTPFGWDLDELEEENGLQGRIIVFEKGMDITNLAILYNACDAFVLLSSGEGLGLPVLESFACKLPVVATRTGAIPELCGEEKRLWMVTPEYSWTNPFGNNRRDFADPKHAAGELYEVLYLGRTQEVVERAYKYVTEERNIEIAAKQVANKVEEILND